MGKITSKELAEIVGAELIGNGNIELTGVAALKDAWPQNVSFLGNIKYKEQVEESNAGAILVGKDYDGTPKEDQALLIVEDPNMVFSKAIAFFAPEPIKFEASVHPSAVVADSATIGSGVHVGANAVIEADAVIGDKTVIGGGVYVGHESKVGNNSLLYPNVTVRERCIIGNNVIIHPGAVIGSDGFGFAPGPNGIVKIPQEGIVQIDDHVEIGANCTIDRARFGKTWLKSGVKLDNLVQVAHNVVVEECAMLIAQCGIAGSTEIGRGAIIAAQAGINGHIRIGDGAQVAGASGVVKAVDPGAKVVGLPAEPPRDFMERISLPKKIKKLTAKIKALEAKLNG